MMFLKPFSFTRYNYFLIYKCTHIRIICQQTSIFHTGKNTQFRKKYTLYIFRYKCYIFQLNDYKLIALPSNASTMFIVNYRKLVLRVQRDPCVSIEKNKNDSFGLVSENE